MIQHKEFEKNFRRKPLYTVYQPIIDYRANKIFGYEALTRGHGKMRLPEQLYRRSYEDGLTISLNLECLNSAFKILPSLSKRQYLFVNVEPVALAHCFGPGLEADFLLMNQIAKYRHRIVFELTEGMKARDLQWIRRGVRFLRDFGCQFAVDDVVGIGTKLLKIVNLRPNFIKLGMSLVQGIQRNTFQKNLARQILDLAGRYNIKIIAEGVERKKEFEAIKKMGISYVQGFYFARPKKEIIKSLRKKF